ncbi:hypothetical protein M378DRAFT_166186 [Amanita muscaria Koide BX008]|uniref:Uncharacterized protein n=1 Tax=Amanita muscaria (strain Koide BX008) TaxID=946122 RepID=A0A0C2WKI8_AMAMK|nr:hypothetical protein M378DRAFT_166186 [Amanita muscaria Koide BX008]
MAAPNVLAPVVLGTKTRRPLNISSNLPKDKHPRPMSLPPFLGTHQCAEAGTNSNCWLGKKCTAGANANTTTPIALAAQVTTAPPDCECEQGRNKPMLHMIHLQSNSNLLTMAPKPPQQTRPGS